jgi:hypothetical protein
MQYRLRQYDWVYDAAPDVDAVVIAAGPRLMSGFDSQS